jgi:hypothetical protein
VGSCDSREIPVSNRCEHINEPPSSIKEEEVHD